MSYARYLGLGGSGGGGGGGGVTSLNSLTGALTLAAGTGISITDNGSNTITITSTSQPAGNYITALTGDGTATGPGSAALTLATVNSFPGTYGSAGVVAQVTVNAKGLVTANVDLPIQIAEGQVTDLVNDLAGKQPTGDYITDLTGDVTASGPGAVPATLATVNADVGSFTNANITVNAKGLITAASNGTTPLNFQVEYRTITSGESAAEQLTLSSTPAQFASMDVITGGPQQLSVDFSVSSNILSWAGLALAGILTTGDVLRIEYFA